MFDTKERVLQRVNPTGIWPESVTREVIEKVSTALEQRFCWVDDFTYVYGSAIQVNDVLRGEGKTKPVITHQQIPIIQTPVGAWTFVGHARVQTQGLSQVAIKEKFQLELATPSGLNNDEKANVGYCYQQVLTRLLRWSQKHGGTVTDPNMLDALGHSDKSYIAHGEARLDGGVRQVWSACWPADGSGVA